MNKLVFILLPTLFLANGLFAQNEVIPEKDKFRIGINIGPNKNAYRGGSFAKGYDSQFNFFTGLFFEYRLKDKLSIAANINYDIKSGKHTSTYFSTDLNNPNIRETTLTFNYINIPIYVQYYINEKKVFYINSDGFYNHLIDVSTKTKSNFNPEDNGGIYVGPIDFNELFEKSDFGFILGVGASIPLDSKNSIMVELRNELGFSDIAKYPQLAPFKLNSLKLVINYNLWI